MTESSPSYEELKARVAELEKQAAGGRSGELEFKVGKGRRERVPTGSLPFHSVLRAVDSSPRCW